jgi:hypothetical protein
MDRGVRCHHCGTRVPTTQGFSSMHPATTGEWFCSVACCQTRKYELGVEGAMTKEIYEQLVRTVFQWKLAKNKK